jgi:homoserine O-succinyltransferase
MENAEKSSLRVAILDLNNGAPNQSMRCLREILNTFADQNGLWLLLDEFDVRQKGVVPDTSYDIYISSGGPGSPLESEGSEWESHYFGWLDQMEKWNADETNTQKKQVFFICHSFQLVCRHYNIGAVTKRKSTSFGVFPVHMMEPGETEPIFEGLSDPFYAVDSRDFQVISPNQNRLEEMGAKILCIEKERTHVPYERAIMAIRFNDNFFGTQFHPEADAIGMGIQLKTADKKRTVIENFGFEKWQSMIDQLQDPDKIMYTYNHIFPNFLRMAVGDLVGVNA